MNRQARPKRRKSHDRITHASAGPDEIKRDMLLAPLDGLAREMDRKWGIDRLPELVGADMAAIWGTTLANLNKAVSNGWVEVDQKKAQADIAACVASAMRGLQAMDASAEGAGASKADITALEYKADNGTVIVVTQDERSWPAIQAERPDVVVYSLREVANALEASKGVFDMVNETKKHFPKAVVRPNPPVDYARGGDEINF